MLELLLGLNDRIWIGLLLGNDGVCVGLLLGFNVGGLLGRPEGTAFGI